MWHRPRIDFENKKRKKRKDFLTRHHLTPRERYKYGTRTWWNEDGDENVLRLYRSKHDAWHKLFKNMTLEEAANVLFRLSRAKCRTHRKEAA